MVCFEVVGISKERCRYVHIHDTLFALVRMQVVVLRTSCTRDLILSATVVQDVLSIKHYDLQQRVPSRRKLTHSYT
jgi:hypothetical protein